MIIRYSELFYSIQGEGVHIGKPAVFFRTFGCDQACSWCDTEYSWKPEFRTTAKSAPVKEVIDLLSGFGSPAPMLILTGGEPMLWGKELLPIVQAVRDKFSHVAIETSGTQFYDLLVRELDHVTLSPKLPSSGMPLLKTEDLDRFLHSARTQVEFKFVIGSQDDFDAMKAYLAAFPQVPVTLMPETDKSGQDVFDYGSLIHRALGLKHAFLRILPRAHIVAWGVRRGV